MEILLITAGVIFLLLIAFISIAKDYVNDNSIRSYKESVHFIEGDKILYVLAHPDDEVLISGTLGLLKKRYNVTISALYLTHGEDGPTGGIVSKDKLREERLKEINDVKEVLNIDSLTLLNYPDRYLDREDPDRIAEDIKLHIDNFKPDYIFTFDNNIGMYGHPDHIVAGKITREVAEKTECVKGIFEMTLPKPMIALALRMSKTFKERYDIDNGLPEPNCAVNIYSACHTRLKVTKCHKSQWQVMAELQPLYNKIPYPIYYLIFNREYYHYTKLN